MRSSTIVTLAAAAAVFVPLAQADMPSKTATQTDRTSTIAASPGTCPFNIVAHSQGTLYEADYPNGKIVLTVSDFHITYSNLLSGKSLKTALGGPIIIEPNSDGTVTVTIDGNDGLFTAPGTGIIYGNAGQLVYLASPDDPFTPIQILKATGHEDPSPFPAVCGALA